MTMTTSPSLSRKIRKAFEKKAVCDNDYHHFSFPEEEHIFEKKALYDHDHHPFPFAEEEENL